MLLKYSPKVEHLKCVSLTPKEGLVLERTLIKLLPGTNEVTNDEWKAMRGNITAEINSGEIVILAQKVSAGRGKVGGVKARDLKDMPVNLAVKYVSECINPDTLTKWYKEITNEEVRLAITKKFKKLDLELPEDEIPETPNESPMTVKEFEEDENDESENSDDSLFEDFDDDSEDDSDDTDSDDTDSNDESDEDEKPKKEFKDMTVFELRAVCEERGIDTTNLSKKVDYLNALANDER